MLAIFRREIRSFFTSPVGYLVIALFLVLMGLFLWVFRGPFNIFDYGFADLQPFFLLAPWIFVFLIPAITMKSFSEEKKLGTLELVLIKPLSIWQTVLGKFSGTFVLTLITTVPTLLYVYTISQMGTTVGNFDLGVVIGSYIGLILLMASYTAIGIFSSVQTDNQIVAFIIGVVLCFVLYYGFEGVATLFPDGETALLVRNFGMKAHFDGFARGVIDTRNLIYLSSITLFFLFLTRFQLQNGYR